MNAVHDIAYLTDLVARLNGQMQALKHSDHVGQVGQVESELQQNRNESTESLTALARKMDGLERYFFSVSDELSFLKRHLNSTTVHQLKAVHDIAILSGLIENLKNEVRNIQTRCQFHQHYTRGFLYESSVRSFFVFRFNFFSTRILAQKLLIKCW